MRCLFYVVLILYPIFELYCTVFLFYASFVDADIKQEEYQSTAQTITVVIATTQLIVFFIVSVNVIVAGYYLRYPTENHEYPVYGGCLWIQIFYCTVPDIGLIVFVSKHYEALYSTMPYTWQAYVLAILNYNLSLCISLAILAYVILERQPGKEPVIEQCNKEAFV